MKNALELCRRIEAYIEKNPKPSVSVKEIALALRIHPSDLDRTFRRARGVTIKKFIDQKSTKLIETRMSEGFCKGCALAQEFGFSSDQAFYRWIKRVFGIPFRQLSRGYSSKR